MDVNDLIEQKTSLEELITQQGFDLDRLLNELLGLENMMKWVWGEPSPNLIKTITRAKAYIEVSKEGDKVFKEYLLKNRELRQQVKELTETNEQLRQQLKSYEHNND